MAEENKTEPGTAHKREDARKEGQIARSHDLSAAAGVLAATALFKPGRLQPGQNVKNMFSAASWSRTARSILPVTVIGWLTYGLVAQSWPVLVRSSAMPVSAALDWLSGMMVSLAWRGGMVLLAWAGVDYCLQRRTHESALKM